MNVLKRWCLKKKRKYEEYVQKIASRIGPDDIIEDWEVDFLMNSSSPKKLRKEIISRSVDRFIEARGDVKISRWDFFARINGVVNSYVVAVIISGVLAFALYYFNVRNVMVYFGVFVFEIFYGIFVLYAVLNYFKSKKKCAPYWCCDEDKGGEKDEKKEAHAEN